MSISYTLVLLMSAAQKRYIVRLQTISIHEMGFFVFCMFVWIARCSAFLLLMFMLLFVVASSWPERLGVTAPERNICHF